MVEIQTAATWSHDYIMLLQSCRNTAGCSTPRHHGSLRAQTTFEDFIPADDLSVVLSQHLLHALDDVALAVFPQQSACRQPASLQPRCASGR